MHSRRLQLQLLQLLLLLLLQLLSSGSVRLQPRHSFSDYVIPLSAGNISSALSDRHHAWLLLCSESPAAVAEFRQAAARLKGLIRFGTVPTFDLQLLNELNFDQKQHTLRSLPHGDAEKKRAGFADFSLLAEALEHAGSSVPADKLSVVTTKEELKKLLAAGIAARPSRFTALFTIEDSTPPLLPRMISQAASQQAYAFGVIPEALSASRMSALGLSGLRWPVPGLSVLSVQADGSVQSSRLNETTRPWAGVGFSDVLDFLLEFNRRHRPQLPGDNQGHDLRVLHMTQLLQQESLLFDVNTMLAQAGVAAVVDADSSDQKQEL